MKGVHMFHTRLPDEEVCSNFNLDTIELVRAFYQAELLKLYNTGKITDDELVARFRKLTLLCKSLYDLMCDLHNISEV